MANDIEKANAIVARWRENNGAWVGRHGQLDRNIAQAVAEGIAVGRMEGLELAGLLISAEVDKRKVKRL